MLQLLKGSKNHASGKGEVVWHQKGVVNWGWSVKWGEICERHTCVSEKKNFWTLASVD